MWKVVFSKRSYAVFNSYEEKTNQKIQYHLKNIKEWLNNENELHTDIMKLHGKWMGYHRIRIGKIRIIVYLDRKSQTIVIKNIGYRGDNYKI
jgi:mRNA-degrading endonuclease RelE of RelBE toxin-antitoxin system